MPEAVSPPSDAIELNNLRLSEPLDNEDTRSTPSWKGLREGYWRTMLDWPLLKNLWLLALKRHKFFTILQIGLPLILPLVFAVFNSKFVPNEANMKNITFFQTVNETEFVKHLHSQIECSKCVIAYEPKTNYTDRIVKSFFDLYDLKLSEFKTAKAPKAWKGFTSESEIETDWNFQLQHGSVELKAVILFQAGFNTPTENDYTNHTFSYVIRIPSIVNDIDVLSGTANQNVGEPNATVASALQLLMDKVLTEVITSDGFPNETILLQAFPRLPTPIKNSQIFGKHFNILFPTLLSLGFIVIVPLVIGSIVQAKQTGLRKLMQMHGLSYHVNWLGWMIHSLIMLSITVAIVLALLFIPTNSVVGGVVKRGSFSLWGIVLLVFCLAATSWCIFMSAFFYEPIHAISYGIFFWLGSYWLLAISTYNRWTSGWKIMLCLFPNLALTYCTEMLLSFDENFTEGANWGMLLNPRNDKDSFTVGYALFLMLLSSVLYNLLAWYFESVLSPSKLRGSERWNFLFRRSFWSKFKLGKASRTAMSRISATPIDCDLKVVINDATFVGRESHSVKQRDDQVLSIANGSEKTTLLLILTGLVAPASVATYTEGFDVTKSTDLLKKRLGYYPDFNVLLADLTVAENLIFSGRLKGLSTRDAKIFMKWMLSRLVLNERKDIPSSLLSDGEKRRLSLGMALIGASKVVLKDKATYEIDLGLHGSARKILQMDRVGSAVIIMTSPDGEDSILAKPLTLQEGERLISEPGTEPRIDEHIVSNLATDNESWEDELQRDLLTGPSLVCQQFWSLVWKRVLCTVREKCFLVVQVMLPILLAVIAIKSANVVWEPSEPFADNNWAAAYKELVTLYWKGEKEMETVAEFLETHYNARLVQNSSVTEALIRIGNEEPEESLNRYIAAAEFGNSHIKAMFALTHFNAASIALSLASNAILRTKKTGNPQINTSVNLMLPNWDPGALDAADQNPKFVRKGSVVVAAVLPIGLALLATSFIVAPVREKASMVKHLQLMTGLNSAVYWVASLFWDVVLTAFVTLIVTLSFRLLRANELYTDATGEIVIMGLLMTYGSVAILFSYMVSTLFSNASKAFAVTMTFHIISGTIGFIAICALKTLGWVNIAAIVSWPLHISPTFRISSGVAVFMDILALNNRCRTIPSATLHSICHPGNDFDLRYRSCCDRCETEFLGATCFKPQPYIQWHFKRWTGYEYVLESGIGLEMLSLLGLGVLYMLALATIESGACMRIGNVLLKYKTAICGFAGYQRSPTEDPNIEVGLAGKELEGIEVKAMAKSYKAMDVFSSISFQVKPKECLGIVGTNGAGKSTLLRILTGDELPSSGHVYVDGVRLENDSWKLTTFSNPCLSKLGYCPQKDGLIGALTGKEMLDLFARLSGDRWQDTDRVVKPWIDCLGLEDYEDTLCSKYSPGQQRLLSVALALVRRPQVLIFDEPTEGLNGHQRTKVLNVIKHEIKNRCAIIATHDPADYDKMFSSVLFIANGETSAKEYADNWKENSGLIEVSIRSDLPQGVQKFILEGVARDLGGTVESVWGIEGGIGACLIHPAVSGDQVSYDKLKEKVQTCLEGRLNIGHEIIRHSVHLNDENKLVSVYRNLQRENLPKGLYELQSQNDAHGQTRPNSKTIYDPRKSLKDLYDSSAVTLKSIRNSSTVTFPSILDITGPTESDIRYVVLKLTNHLDQIFNISGSCRANSDVSSFQGEEIASQTTRSLRFRGTDWPCFLVCMVVADDTNLCIFGDTRSTGIMLLGGFCAASKSTASLHQYKEEADLLSSLQLLPQLWSPPCEQFIQHRRFLARVCAGEVNGSGVEVCVDVLKTNDGEEGVSVANANAIRLNEQGLNGNVSYHNFLLWRILDLGLGGAPYAAVIDIENRLNHSLTHNKEVVLHCESDKRMAPPNEILPFTRETFYDSGSETIKAMFSYSIKAGAEELILIVAYAVGDLKNSYAFALLQHSTESTRKLLRTVSYDRMMNPDASTAYHFRKYVFDDDRDQEIQMGSIQVRVSMTKGKKSILTLRIFMA